MTTRGQHTLDQSSPVRKIAWRPFPPHLDPDPDCNRTSAEVEHFFQAKSIVLSRRCFQVILSSKQWIWRRTKDCKHF
ncbi:unnamed protein product [Knipowitschia caucasica]